MNTHPLALLTALAIAATTHAQIRVLKPKDFPAVARLYANTGSGTATLVRDQSTAITALHVVQGATQIQLVFPGANTNTPWFNAKIIATNPTTDTAILKLDQPVPTKPRQLSTNYPKPGSRVQIPAYGGYPRNSFSANIIRVQAIRNRTLLFKEAYSHGDSGAPILHRGAVVGTLYGGKHPAELRGWTIANLVNSTNLP